VIDGNPLPGVPSVESPFFEQLFDASDPLYPLAKSLHDDGYAVLDFPDDEFPAVAEAITSSLHDRYDWARWHAGGADLRVQDAWQWNPAVRRVACNPTVIDLLSRLYGRRAFPFQTLNFPVGSQQHVHTDAVHFSSRPERFMCGVWVALEDVGPDQGPLVYYPASHRLPIYTREHIERAYFREEGSSQGVFEPLWRRLIEAHGLERRTFAPRRGQALIWAANLLHGGDVHHDRRRTRWSQVTHYYFEDCVYYTPLSSNEPRGEIFHREPPNIALGAKVHNRYLGYKVDPVAAAKPLDFGSRIIPVPHGLPAFDPAGYLKHNPDVAAAGVDPAQHYDLYGRHEQRRWYD